MDSAKWHSLDAEKQRKYVSLFCQHFPTMEQEFKKPHKSVKKANKKTKKKRRLQKSSLKEFRKMRKEQLLMIQIFNHKFHTFYFSGL